MYNLLSLTLIAFCKTWPVSKIMLLLVRKLKCLNYINVFKYIIILWFILLFILGNLSSEAFLNSNIISSYHLRQFYPFITLNIHILDWVPYSIHLLLSFSYVNMVIIILLNALTENLPSHSHWDSFLWDWQFGKYMVPSFVL